MNEVRTRAINGSRPRAVHTVGRHREFDGFLGRYLFLGCRFPAHRDDLRGLLANGYDEINARTPVRIPLLWFNLNHRLSEHEFRGLLLVFHGDPLLEMFAK
jgi:hypothetical protein